MAYTRKTWQQKLHNGHAAKVERVDKRFADIPEGASMLVPTPEMVDAYIKNIPEGTQSTLAQMRKDLAAENGVEYCCPITSGIFLRIAAEAAYEAHSGGKSISEVTPFWRILDRKSPAVNKVTFDKDFIRQQRATEGLPW